MESAVVLVFQYIVWWNFMSFVRTLHRSVLTAKTFRIESNDTMDVQRKLILGY